jgi:hypothetical protein
MASTSKQKSVNSKQLGSTGSRLLDKPGADFRITGLECSHLNGKEVMTKKGINVLCVFHNKWKGRVHRKLKINTEL